ncbi:MAG: Ig-like domain-containing protein [Propionibacteriaceae bacterium]|nr:Ig-like domain-containing protein [Propionibacteriaceae bacterium]
MSESRGWLSAVRVGLAGSLTVALLMSGNLAAEAAGEPGPSALPDRPFDENGTGWIYNYVHEWPGQGTEYRGEFPYMDWAYEDEGPGYPATRYSFITEQLNNGWYTDRGQSGMIVYGPYKAGGHWRGLTAIDHFNTDPEQNGTLEDFRELVAAAHAKGITVVTYIALIYLHHQNPLFLQAEQDVAPGGAYWSSPGVPDPSYDGPADLFLWDTRAEGGVYHLKTSRCGQWDAERRAFNGQPCNSTTDAYTPPAGMASGLPQAAWWAWSETAQRWYGTSWRFPAINYFTDDGIEYAKSVVKFWLDQGVDGFEFDAPQSMWGAQANSNHFGVSQNREWVSTEIQVNTPRSYKPDKQLYLHAEGMGTYSNMVANDRVGYTHVLINGDNDWDSFAIRVAPKIPGSPEANENGGTVTVDQLEAHWQAYFDSRRMNGRGVYAWSVYNWEQPHQLRALDAAVQAGMGAVYSIDYQEYWTPNTTQVEPGGLDEGGEELYFDVFRTMKKSKALVPAATRERVPTNADNRGYAILRRSPDRSETVLALYNFDSWAKGLKVNFANTGVAVPQVPTDLATGQPGSAIEGEQQTFWLPAFGYKFLRVQAGPATPDWSVIDSSDPAWELGTGISHLTDASARGGSRIVGTGQSGDIRIEFTGTAVEGYGWKGRRGSGTGALGSSTVQVFIDGDGTGSPDVVYQQHLNNVSPIGGWPSSSAGLYNQKLFSITGLASGTHMLLIKDGETAGRPFGVDFIKVANEEFTSPTQPVCDASCTDDAAPETVIAVGAPEYGDFGPVTFELSATDDKSGVVLTEYQLNGGDWVVYEGPVTLSAAGSHEVNYRSTDLAGNRAEAATEIVEVVAPGDPATLNSLIGTLSSLVDAGKLASYTGASRAALVSALETAREVGDAPAKQDAIDAAYQGLLSALEGLELTAPDTSLLRQVTADAEVQAATKGFTPESVAALRAAIAAAKIVLADPAADEQAIDAAVAAVARALAELRPAVAAPVTITATKVKLAQSQLRLVKGASFTLASRVYRNGANPTASGVTWKSSNTKIATVSASGKITAKKAGTVTITATTKAKTASGSALSASIKVTVVSKKPKAKVTKVTASVPKTMKLGQTVFITGKYSSSKATGVKVTYATKKPNVVTVDKVGRLVAVSKGTDTIVVKAGKKTKTYKVTVR